MKAQYIKIDEKGHKFYYSDHKMMVFHREDGPAIEYVNGDRVWYLNGLFHCEDGPAIQWVDGPKWWYLNGQCISEAEHTRRTAKETVLTMEEIAAKFGVSVEKLKIKK